MFSLLPRRNGANGQAAQSKMFSEQDILDICESLPPLKNTDHKGSDNLPSLILSHSGEGFVTSDHITHSFENLVANDKDRISTMKASLELDVDKDVILQLVYTFPQLAMLSEDQSTIITTKERSSMLGKLREALSRGLISKSVYSKEYNVSRSSIDTMVSSRDFGETIDEINDHLVSRGYEQSLTISLKAQIENSVNELEPLAISSSSLVGAPPLWFVKRIYEQIVGSKDLSPAIITREEEDTIRCIPKALILRQSQTLISELEAGTLSHVDKREFADSYEALYSSMDEVNALFEATPFVFNCGSYAISQPYLSDRAKQDLTSLDNHGGYVNIWKDWFQSMLPQDITQSIAKQVINVFSSLPANIRQAGSVFYTSSSYQEAVTTLINSAQQQAKDHASSETPVKDLKFRMEDVLHTISPIAREVIALKKDEELEKSIVDHFWTTIAETDSQNEAEFSAFWTRRVVSRRRNHCEALDAIEDPKFRDQLADLLSTYIRTELILDTLSKARTQGLMRSSKTLKNVQKLETSLESSKKDLASTLSYVDRFEKRQEIPNIETAALEEAKNALVGERVRRMQKPKVDGPLLFLTLVVVLFAKHNAGVIYSTGKFAPKLLKQLKSKLSAEDYEKLEQWKEMAKSGTLGSNEQKLMVQMAE